MKWAKEFFVCDIHNVDAIRIKTHGHSKKYGCPLCNEERKKNL